MKQHPSDHALIIGGGIGGVTAAIALAQRGQTVSIYEQAPAFAEIGAGITISPSAFRGLASLGLGEKIAQSAEPVTNAPMLNYLTGEPITLDEQGLVDAKLPEEGVGRHIHRADLHAILIEALSQEPNATIHTDKSLTEVKVFDDKVSAHFSDGSAASGDLVIGSDGLRSATRQSLYGHEDPKFTGQVAWRFLAPMAEVKPYLKGRFSSIFVGPRAIFVIYPIRGGTVANCVAIARTDSWRLEGWMHQAKRSELETIFQGWTQSVLDIIALSPEEHFFKWALFDRDAVASWTKGRATLLGDAAHPMLPFLGMGGAMAIEDAVVLARALDTEGDIPTRLKRYEQARIERTTLVLEASRRQGVLFQDGNVDGYGKAKPPIHDASFFTYDPVTVAI